VLINGDKLAGKGDVEDQRCKPHCNGQQVVVLSGTRGQFDADGKTGLCAGPDRDGNAGKTHGAAEVGVADESPEGRHLPTIELTTGAIGKISPATRPFVYARRTPPAALAQPRPIPR
jgi:hypothetical protein